MDKHMISFLLDTHRVNDCHFAWCQQIAHSQNPTKTQIKTAQQLEKTTKRAQSQWVIINDKLIPAITKHKKYQWNDENKCWKAYKLTDGKWCLIDKYKADSK